MNASKLSDLKKEMEEFHEKPTKQIVTENCLEAALSHDLILNVFLFE